MMAEQFDAKKEADTVENLGYMLLHGYNGEFTQYTEKLGELSPLQAEALNEQLKWDNWKPTKEPSVEMLRTQDGHVSGFAFKPSFRDTDAQAAYLVISVGKPGDDK